MKQTVKKLLIAIDPGIEFVWKSKYYMEVKRIHDFRPVFIIPDLFEDNLIVGAVLITAGIIVEDHVLASYALTDIDTRPARLTSGNRMRSILLFFDWKCSD